MGKIIGRDLEKALDFLGPLVPGVAVAHTVLRAVEGDDDAKQALPDHAKLALAANGLNIIRDDQHAAFAHARADLRAKIGCDDARLHDVLSILSSTIYETARDLTPEE